MQKQVSMAMVCCHCKCRLVFFEITSSESCRVKKTLTNGLRNVAAFAGERVRETERKKERVNKRKGDVCYQPRQVQI